MNEERTGKCLRQN